MKETLDSKKDKEDLGIRLRRFIWRIASSFFRLITCKRRKPQISKTRQRANSVASQVSELSSDDENTPTYKTHHRQGSAEPMLLSPAPHRPSAYYRYRRRSSSFSALVRPTFPREPDQPPPPRRSLHGGGPWGHHPKVQAKYPRSLATHKQRAGAARMSNIPARWRAALFPSPPSRRCLPQSA